MNGPSDALFDKRAAGYNADNSWHVRYAERLVELAAPAAGMRILDAATGTGLAAIAAARIAGPRGRVVGVDISGGMLAKAKQAITVKGLRNVDLLKADATGLAQLADGSFDVVLCSAGLLYLPVRTALREWRRLLRPGGRLGFSTMKEGFPVAARLFREHAAGYGLTLTDPATPLGTPTRCRQVVSDAGLIPTDMVTETVRFSRADLDHAWEAHVNGPHHDAVATLGPATVQEFRAAYTAALSALPDDEVLDAEVIYAFARR